MKADVISEMNPYFKIIRYTFETPNSNNDEKYDAQSEFFMLVSYQVLGEKRDKATISLLEIDQHTFTINPINFVIISQKINKHATKFSSFGSANSHMDYRAK